jgi:putative transposase
MLNNYVLSVLRQPDITVRSATLTRSKVCVSFSKETPLIQPKGLIGIDRNLNNMTAVDSLDNILIHDLSKVTRIKSSSRRTVAKFKRDDSRIRRRIAGKYGRIQRNRTQSILHNATKKLVDHARINSLGVALENIKGLRRLYRKGNGQGSYYRGRLNSWPFYEMDRQVSYKMSWIGLPVFHVDPNGTTSKCSVCGDRMVFSKESRTLHCPSCGYYVDRDVNAARNVLSAGLRFSLLGPSNEAVKGNPMTTVLPGVDDSQSSLQSETHLEQPKT